jgi:uncharacterized membrane protein YgdD (TMEM256/DUF423 family)
MGNKFIGIGGLNALLSVAVGAFGAHGLKGTMPADLMEIYQTGVQYHMVHALGLLLIGLLINQSKSSEGRAVSAAGWCLLAGIILFSGSLYALSLSGIRWLGAITPLGGVCFLAGWLLVVIHAWKKSA